MKAFQYYLQLSIPYLYMVSGVLLLVAGTRLFFEFKPSMAVVDDQNEAVSIPYMSMPNTSPLVVGKLLSKALRECFDLNFDTLDEDLKECADSHFSSSGRVGFIAGLKRTDIIKLIEGNPNDQVVTDAVIINGPALTSSGRTRNFKQWRFQSTLLITHYLEDSYITTPFLVDATVRFDYDSKGGEGLYISRFDIFNDSRTSM